MAGIAEILKEIKLKLDEEVQLLVTFHLKTSAISVSSKKMNAGLFPEFISFDLKLTPFTHNANKILLQYVAMGKNIKKVSKKPSPTPGDVDSLTQRIENLTEKMKILNVEGETLVVEGELLVKQYLATKK